MQTREPTPDESSGRLGEVRPTVCPLDCADTCSIDATIIDDRLVRVQGGSRNPFTRGKLCAKVVNAFPDQVHGPRRLRTPLERHNTLAGHDFRPISWETALERIHDEFRRVATRWGPEAIAPLCYGGPMGLLAGGSMDKRFFHRLGATKVDSSPLCAGTSSAAWETVFGDAGGVDFEELNESRLILVWGNNITTCNLHATTIIRGAQKRGAKLVVVDPKRIRIARDADLHIPLLPGTDVVLAYAVARLLEERGGLDRDFIERQVHGAAAFLDEARSYDLERAAGLCGVEPALIERLADLLVREAPAAMAVGVAPERNRNGSAGLRAAFSIMALSGNIGPRGAGICDTSRFFPMDKDALERPDLAPAGVREINVLDVPRYVRDPGQETPLRALFIYNHNPVAVHPQQRRMREALLSEDVFVVGHDVSMTDSMACCDLVLPAPTHFEYGDLYKAYGHRYLQRSRAVLPLQGDALSNMELFRRLAERFDFDESCFREGDDELAAKALSDLGEEVLADAEEGAVDMSDHAEPAMGRGAAYTTPSGRIEVYSEAMEAHCGQGLPRYAPLADKRAFLLVSPASEQRVNSTFGSTASQQSDIACEIHPDDAAPLAIRDGEPVVLHNEAGEVRLPAKLTTDVRRGTLYVPKGAWMSDSGDIGTINALIPGHQEAAIGGACYYDCSVDIRPA